MRLLKRPQAKITDDGEVKLYEGGFVYFRQDSVIGLHHVIDRYDCVVKNAFVVQTQHGQFLVSGKIEDLAAELVEFV